MFTRLRLRFEQFPSREMGKLGLPIRLTRLLGDVEFETTEGWSKPYLAILDTGAPLCLLPLDLWQSCQVQVFAHSYPLRGIVPKEECALPVQIGRMALRLTDEEHAGRRLEVIAFLAPNNAVPLLLGFHSCLERYRIVLDFQGRVAYAIEHVA